MPYPQQDIRVTKTHKALAETMMGLLEQKSFQKITINDICQNAMVSRSTFYFYFEDKYQLLLFCLQIERERLEMSMKKKEPREFIHSMLSIIKEREKWYHNLFKSEINLELIQMLQNFFYEFFSDSLTEFEKQGAELAGPIPLLAVYYSNGLTGMVMWWIENGFSYSVDEMTLCQYNLISDILPD